MSFESGRMSGLVGSLILVIAPAIMVGLNGVLLFTFYSTIISAITNAGQLAVPNFPSVLLSAISLTIVALAILCLSGFVLVIIAMYRLSLYYNEPDIFKNTLYGLIVSVVGTISLVASSFCFYSIFNRKNFFANHFIRRLSFYRRIYHCFFSNYYRNFRYRSSKFIILYACPQQTRR